LVASEQLKHCTQVKPVSDTCLPIDEVRGGGEYPLPTPLAIRVGVPAGQFPRQRRAAQSTSQIPIVLATNQLQMLPECWLDLRWQHGHTIFLSFPVAKKQFAAREIDVLHAQLESLELHSIRLLLAT
jgi:hypothetical protein